MSYVVEMFREAAEAKGRDLFSCSLLDWRCFQALGQEFGWDPLGSTYVALPGTKYVHLAGRDYEPGDARDRKQVSEEDALAWANALDASILSPRLPEALSRVVPPQGSHSSFVNLMKEFAQYCYGGAFVYSMTIE